MDIIKAFENNDATLHITIHGTHEEPLFRASDIGEFATRPIGKLKEKLNKHSF